MIHCILFISPNRALMINLKYASLFGLLCAVVAMIMLLSLNKLFAVEPIGITVQVLAAGLMLWARITFGRRSFHAAANPTAGGLVTSGPYKYWRHPIYAAIIYFAWTGAISNSIAAITAILATVITLGLFVRMIAEEKLVAEQYPEYEAYAAKTKRIIPFIF